MNSWCWPKTFALIESDLMTWQAAPFCPGFIPKQLGALNQLENLRLENNKLTGEARVLPMDHASVGSLAKFPTSRV